MKASSEQRYGDHRRGSGQQWPGRQGVEAAGGAYGRGEFATGGYGVESGVVGSDVPPTLSDDPLARDPYAGTR
jgi:hypothetical protein